MTHQPATSISISFLSSFNRAGGRTSNVRNETMSLPYSETASGVVTILGLVVPISLGIIRGIFPRSGWVFLFAAISGLAGWCSLHFSILINVWSHTLLDAKDVSGLGSNGAANAFASVLGWLPGVALFFLTLFLTCAAFRWIPNKLKNANKPAPSNGEQPSSLNSGFPTRRG